MMNSLKKLEVFLAFIFNNLKRIAVDIMGTTLFKKSVYFLPIVILCFNLVFHLIVTLRIASLNYDEFVLLAISKQPWTEFLDTTQVEPHPLGFYLLLRAFDFIHLSTEHIRIAVTAFFHVSLIFATVIAYKAKLVEKLNIKLGLSLAFTSFCIFEIGCQIKQDVISFPFFILFFISAYILFLAEKSQKTLLLKSLILVSAIGVVFISYIYFLFTLISLGLFFVFSLIKKNRQTATFFLSCLVVILTLFALYYFSFGHLQIENNYLSKNRFLWTKDIPNSFIHRLPEITAGVRLYDPLSDIFTLTFLVLFSYAIYQYRETKKTELILFISLFLSYMVVSYVLRLFVQNRYGIPTFFLFFLICGAQWGKKTRYILVGIIYFVLYTKTATLVISAISNTLAFQELSQSLQSLPVGEKTGLLSNVPGVSVYIKVRFLNNLEEVFPLSTSKNTSIIPAYSFNRQHFSESSEVIQKSTEELSAEFRNLKFERFIYIDSVNSAYGYYDPEERIKNSLSSMCRTIKPSNQFDNVTIYVFTECE